MITEVALYEENKLAPWGFGLRPMGEAVEIKVEEDKGVNWEAEELITALQEELRQLREQNVSKVKEVSNLKKNQKPGKPSATRKYVRLGTLKVWGNVPQQQADIAQILIRCMEVGKEYSEAEVFNFLVDNCGDYVKLRTSVQDVTYLFRYYRGLKNDGKHASFVARDFLRVIG